jgi:hypothetical protein
MVEANYPIRGTRSARRTCYPLRMPSIDRSQEYLAKAASFDRLAKLADYVPAAACACRHLAQGYRALAAAAVGQGEANDPAPQGCTVPVDEG